MPVTMTSQVEDEAAAGRSGIALSLSGGGFRASLFHLGAVRRLHELGVLQQLNAISTVSGGSILAGQLVQSMHDKGRNGRLDFLNFQADVADPFRAVASRDLRTWPVLKNLAWNWIAPGPLLKDLEERYRRRITTLNLEDLPITPRFIFCATDLTFGVNWEFARDRVGSYQAGYIFDRSRSSGANDTAIAHAITASACFPPFFGPMPVGMPADAFRGGTYQAGKSRKRRKVLEKLSLSDGGIYDNMGLEPVWIKAATVLVSDGGAPFDYAVGKPPFRTLLRYASVISKQTQSLRIRMLNGAWNAKPGCGAYDGTRWHLASGKSSKPQRNSPPSSVGYSEDFAKTRIAMIRTDLDSFSEGEMSILENHGYCNADYRLRRSVPQCVPRDAPAPVPPYPEWMDEKKAEDTLRVSDRRFVAGRMIKGIFQ
jgi:NTE family protein